MNLRRTRRHWEKFAQTDPLWAILTVAERKGNKWDVEEFFRTGEATVAADLGAVRAVLPGLRLGQALDFGCGVGRLTQALAGRFQSVVGVDLAANMLDLARRHNRLGARVEFRHNPDPDLRQFADGRFDFVYSILTLQHVEPADALRYVREFVRVTAPGGAVFFHVPGRTPRRPPTLWPDTLLKRVYRDARRRFSSEPLMEMHGLAPSQVEAALAAAGATLVERRSYAAAEQFDSWAYLATRRER